MASYPYARVAYLTGLQPAPYMTASAYGHKSTTTPTTISGNPTALYSYALQIMLRSDLGYWLHDDNSSPTTNRHIRTVAAFLDANGYKPTDMRKDDGYTAYTLWAKS